VDGAVVDTEPPLSHHLFQVPVTEPVAAIPAYVKQDEVVLKMLPLEGGGMGHELEMGSWHIDLHIIAPFFCDRTRCCKQIVSSGNAEEKAVAEQKLVRGK